MDERILRRHFARIGAEFEIGTAPVDDGRFIGWQRRNLAPRTFLLDVREERRKGVYELIVREDVVQSLDAVTIDVRPEQRHLLLLMREVEISEEGKQKFLCGHDERHWFVASVANSQPVKSVQDAMEALKPEAALVSQREHRVKPKNWNKRRNAGYLRQGEWFFLPCPDLEPENEGLILRNEPIMRSGGTPHIVELLHRRGGTTVYVNYQHQNGLTEKEYASLVERNPDARKENWRIMQRDAEVYAMGKIRHPDHKTVVLWFWHRVMMSTETWNGSVAFLD